MRICSFGRSVDHFRGFKALVPRLTSGWRHTLPHESLIPKIVGIDQATASAETLEGVWLGDH